MNFFRSALFSFCLLLGLEVQGNEVLDKLHLRMKDSLVCVGLDPDPDKMPFEIMTLNLPLEERVFLFLTNVIDITAEHSCAYKLQKAFYDDFSNGHALLVNVVKYIKSHCGDMPVFVDCKIGDIGNTMTVYIHNLFDQIKADGIVVNPYMGDDVFLPFSEDPEKVGLVLVQTSNPGAKIVQELKLETGELLWEKMLQLTLDKWNKNLNLIPIVSSNTENYDYQALRKAIPQEVPILLAGIGAQGGNLSILRDLLNENKSGVFINSSRGILYPYTKESGDWREKILQETLALKDQINALRYESKFLLLLGPSGVGKSTIIKELQQLDERFTYIKPFTTRALREGEVDKIQMPLPEIFALQDAGKLIALNHMHGNYYATPLDPILTALSTGLFPVLDWPAAKVNDLKKILGDSILSVFIYVDQMEDLSKRLNLDGRDRSGERFEAGRLELEAFFKGDFDDLIDYKWPNAPGSSSEIAKAIYDTYLNEIQ